MINLHINALFFTFLNASVSFSIIIELHLTKLQRLPMLVLAKCKFELWELLRNQITKCRANQWTGFYMITASAMKELSHCKISYFQCCPFYLKMKVSSYVLSHKFNYKYITEKKPIFFTRSESWDTLMVTPKNSSLCARKEFMYTMYC